LGTVRFMEFRTQCQLNNICGFASSSFDKDHSQSTELHQPCKQLCWQDLNGIVCKVPVFGNLVQLDLWSFASHQT
jgi:hypothetical protein